MKRKFYNIYRFLAFCFVLNLSLYVLSNPCLADKKISNDILLQDVSKASEENNKFECEVNCCFSIGQICRSAYHI